MLFRRKFILAGLTKQSTFRKFTGKPGYHLTQCSSSMTKTGTFKRSQKWVQQAS
nr:hypothetical protein Iba_chr02aCG3900 [Ipomoea batatas]